MAAIDLCTVDEVKGALGIPEGSTDRDQTIADYITAASRRVMRYAGREFISEATVGATRRFAYKGARSINFAPYDLRADASYTFVMDGITLVEDSDFYLDPLPAEDGVYEKAVLFNLYPAPYGRPVLALSALGRAVLEVTGTWGFPSVPEDVNLAAIRTVTAWLDAGTPDQYGLAADDARVTAPSSSSFDVPYAARMLLSPFRRMGVG